MIKFRFLLNNMLGRLRYLLAKLRKKLLDVTALSPGHWKWAARSVLIIMGLFMAGVGIDFIGELHVGVFLVVLVFLPGLALLAGLGVRLGIKVLNLLPEKQSWIFYGAFFFVALLFSLSGKLMVLVTLFIILTASFLGAAIYNLSGGRWTGLSGVRRILTLVFLALGLGLFTFGAIFLLYPGKEAGEVKAWSMEAANLPASLELSDPAQPGTYTIDSLYYGWGKDKPRKEFGSGVALLTQPVDGSNFLDGWEKLSGKLRTRYWRMGPDSLALNGRVWFPVGEGPFPLVLIVHGNHLDRDYSDPGYDYLGRHFATLGIIAVSIDENFLNGAWSDFSKGLETENDCRGWLLLKHLEQWREWNSCDTVPFYQKVDLDRVVLIGHSRGGEAVSVASCFNRLPYYPDNAKEVFDFNFGILGVGAIAPVDGQYHPAGIATPVENVNYFTIHGSMDGDMRSFDGLRQMLRVGFSDSLYHFSAGLYLHGANHGQFNRSWGIFDNGYPQKLFLDRKAIIPVEQQEQVALVYLTAFVLESCYPGSGYLPLFRDYRYGRHWLPDLVQLNQFRESTTRVLCDYEEDLDLSTGTSGIDSINASGLALWKEGRIPKRWGDYRKNAVFLGWNNEKDSIPGRYTLFLDRSVAGQLDGTTAFTFLAADAQIDPGDRNENAENGSGEDNSGNMEGNMEETNNVKQADSEGNEENEGIAENEGNEENEGKEDTEGIVENGGNAEAGEEGEPEDKKDNKDEEEEPIPVDFAIVFTDTSGLEYGVRLGDFQKLQPAIKPQVFKSRMFTEDSESEVIPQYVSLPLEMIRDSLDRPVTAGAIRSISFVFDAEEKGTVLVDQLGFSR